MRAMAAQSLPFPLSPKVVVLISSTPTEACPPKSWWAVVMPVSMMYAVTPAPVAL
jgi:hypothetical protein